MFDKLKFSRNNWISFLILNAFLFIIIYALCMLFVTNYVSQNFYDKVDKNLYNYMQEVKKKNLPEELKKIGSGNPNQALLSSLDPTIPLVWYIRDNYSGEVEKLSTDVFLSAATSASVDTNFVKKYNDYFVRGYSFRTYTDSVYESVEDDFTHHVVLYYATDIDEQTKQLMIKTSVNMVWIFIVLSLAEGMLMAYLLSTPFAIETRRQRSFMRDMAHELNTPLAVLKGNLEIMLEDTTISNEAQNNIALMIGEVDRMNRMSRGLIEINSKKTDSAKRAGTIEIKDTLDEMAELYGDFSETTQIDFEADINNAFVKILPSDLKRVVSVLLDNAFKYSGDGATIFLQSKKLRKAVQIVVADTGVGVREDELEKLCTKFFRGHNASEEKGTGLGLAIAQKIIKSYGGSLSVRKNEPTGLIFAITLKCVNDTIIES